MNTSKKLLATAVAASTMAFASVAPMANAEVSASVGVASSYLWRGADLGTNSDGNGAGTPAVWGDINYSASGFTGGVWVSSGDATLGTEYDLYLGYGGEVEDFSYSVTLVNYLYPESDIHAGDVSDLVLGVGYGPVSLTYYDNIAGASGYTYTTVAADAGDFSFLLGFNDGAEDDRQHFDISYSFNDNLSFTLSNVIDSDAADNDDSTVVVSYTLPLQ